MIKNGALAHREELTHPTEPAGAALIQLGSRNKVVKVQPQKPLEPGVTWAEEDIADAARWVQGPYFYTVHEGDECKLQALCPICKEGQQVTEWLI